MNSQTTNGTNYVVRGLPSAAENSIDKIAAVEVVVFIHGIGSYHTCFNQSVAYLHANYPNQFQTIQYDLLGRGYSSPSSNGKYGLNDHIEQLEQLLLHLKVSSKFHLIAHSMGGVIATQFASLYPNKIKSLSLLSPAGLMDTALINTLKMMKCLHGTLKNGIKNGNEKAWRGDFYHHDGSYEALLNEYIADLHQINKANPNHFEAFWQSVLQFPLSGLDWTVTKVGLIPQLPILLLWGKKDVGVPYKPNYKRWKRLLQASHETDPNKKCLLTAKAFDEWAHGFMLEYPEETNKEIASFLNFSLQNTTPSVNEL